MDNIFQKPIIVTERKTKEKFQKPGRHIFFITPFVSSKCPNKIKIDKQVKTSGQKKILFQARDNPRKSRRHIFLLSSFSFSIVSKKLKFKKKSHFPGQKKILIRSRRQINYFLPINNNPQSLCCIPEKDSLRIPAKTLRASELGAACMEGTPGKCHRWAGFSKCTFATFVWV